MAGLDAFLTAATVDIIACVMWDMATYGDAHCETTSPTPTPVPVVVTTTIDYGYPGRTIQDEQRTSFLTPMHGEEKHKPDAIMKLITRST
ncbi:MAG TPA: hypothetical protein G4O08_08305 [Anaerolineae bacterium]|nr:hypothetical protein [Anaerolineae bacterium]